jgi:hypothetical protein
MALTEFPEFYSIMGIWEGTGIAGTLFGSLETKRRIEVRANCVDNNPCVDVYHLDRDVTYLSLPYNPSLSIGTTHCFGGYDSDSNNGTEYSICLSPQSHGSLEFSEGDVSFSGDGILQKVEE